MRTGIRRAFQASVAAFVLLFVLALTSEAGAQTWIELAPAGSPPDPIYAPKPAHYDAANNRLIVFFPGNPPFGGFGNQVWVLTNANGLGGIPVWIQLAPAGTPPNSNGLESVVYDEIANRLIVYGGCLVNCSPARDSVFVLTNANGLGGTPVWSQSPVTNPQARVDHSAVYDAAGELMIAFGGHFAFYGTDQNDTRILSNANGIGSPSAWTTLPASGPPGIRGRHSAVYDPATNRMTVFAGQRLISCCYSQSDYNDVWVLENANGQTGTPAWTQLAPLGGPPDVRSGHSAVYDPAHNRMIVFGGSKWNQAGQTSEPLGDLWELSHANGLGGTPVWTPVTASGTPPGPRSYHWAAFDTANQRMILVGGRNDNESPQVSNRVWVLMLTPAAETFTALGDSFLRAGADNTNEGANPNLVIRADGKNRVLVTFDLAGLSGPVAQASLRLYAVHNADNWGNTGRTLDAHRVTQPWIEGNGANLQPGNLTNAPFNPYQNRGEGPGVTWRCSADGDVHDQVADCDPRWDGGAYAATSTASVTIYKDFAGNGTLPPTAATLGWISFDVTADVNTCLSESAAECGWLIRKTEEGQPGRVEFASKEGAAALYDSQAGEPVAPQLVVQP